MYHTIVNDIKNFVFGPAKAPVYGFGRNRKQKFVMSFTIRLRRDKRAARLRDHKDVLISRSGVFDTSEWRKTWRTT